MIIAPPDDRYRRQSFPDDDYRQDRGGHWFDERCDCRRRAWRRSQACVEQQVREGHGRDPQVVPTGVVLDEWSQTVYEAAASFTTPNMRRPRRPTSRSNASHAATISAPSSAVVCCITNTSSCVISSGAPLNICSPSQLERLFDRTPLTEATPLPRHALLVPPQSAPLLVE